MTYADDICRSNLVSLHLVVPPFSGPAFSGPSRNGLSPDLDPGPGPSQGPRRNLGPGYSTSTTTAAATAMTAVPPKLAPTANPI